MSPPPGAQLIISFLVALAACSSPSNTSSGERAVDGSPDAPTPTEVVGMDDEPETAPLADVLDFTAPAVGGGKVAGSEFAGRDVAMWFWAPT